MVGRNTTRVRWDTGKETVLRLFPEQAKGTACVFCSLSDGTLIPVGRTSENYVVAHVECKHSRAA